MSFVAFQQFEPQERKCLTNCIWCGEIAATNRAHIISRKLAVGARKAPTLRFNVCNSCNSKCGKLEEWILRFTPLSWLRLMLYLQPGHKGTTRYIPSYFFSAALNEWIVFHLEAQTHSYAVATQILFLKGSCAELITQAAKESHEALRIKMLAALEDKTCKVDVRASLPEDFSPRLILEGNTVILIVRSDIDKQQLIKNVPILDSQTSTTQQLQLGNTGRERYHFQWSKANWVRFCAKTAFEALCLFEGGEKCLRPAFQLVRDFVINGEPNIGKEIVFHKRGPLSSKDVPLPVFIDLTVGQNAPSHIPALLPYAEPGMHVVILYEIQGWIMASIIFCGFPSSILILGGPDEHLADLYQLIYDNQEEEFDFIRLAYDQTKPIIPIELPGKDFSALAKTYRLHGV